jgi:hypothetical protein
MNTGLERRLAKLERIAPQDKNLQTLGEFIKELSGDPFSESGPIWVSFASGLGVDARDPHDFDQKIAELKHCGKVDDSSLVTRPAIFFTIVKWPPPHQATGR